MKLELVLAVSLGCTACVTVRPVAAPVNFIPQQNPPIIWVTTSEETIPVLQPGLSGDTLVGRWLGTNDALRLPLSQVQLVQARQPDRTRTALMVAGAAAIAGFIVWRTTRSGAGSSNCIYEPGPGTICD